jgi:transposase-like protein
MSSLTIRQQKIQQLEELLEFYQTHSTIEDLAKRYGVVPYTVAKWRTLYPDFPKPSERTLSLAGFKSGQTLRRTAEVDEWLAVRRFDNPKFGRGRK